MLINHSSPASAIKAWQTFLNNHGYAVGTADGIWGAHTEEGSKKFQEAEGLTADGLVGTQTIAAASKEGFTIPKPEQFQPPGTLNAVVDISHHNAHPDFIKAKAAGMLAVFHKATEFTKYVDHTYDDRRTAAVKAGLHWGAYHFGAAANGAAEADFFLSVAKPDGKTLLVLDFEPATTKGESDMTLAQAEAFVNRIKEKTGKYPGLYGGSYLKQLVRAKESAVLKNCWLWLAEYGSHAYLPNGWDTYTFWQFTDGAHGPGALPVDGIGSCDRDLFNGTADELTAFWAKHSV